VLHVGLESSKAEMESTLLNVSASCCCCCCCCCVCVCVCDKDVGKANCSDVCFIYTKEIVILGGGGGGGRSVLVSRSFAACDSDVAVLAVNRRRQSSLRTCSGFLGFPHFISVWLCHTALVCSRQNFRIAHGNLVSYVMLHRQLYLRHVHLWQCLVSK